MTKRTVAFCPFKGYNFVMKTFKYKFTVVQTVLIIAGIILSAAGFTLNLVMCIRDGVKNAAQPVYPIIQYTLMFFVTVVAFALLLSILLFSAYVIDGKTFKTRFGFIVSKYDCEKITTVTLDRRTKKLTVAFKSGEFMVIVVKQDWYEDFIAALLETNPAIEYNIVSLENDIDEDKKK